MNKNKKIKFLAVDLDGVCINFSEAAARAHGIDLPIDNLSDDYIYNIVGGKNKFWKKCSGDEFWATLLPYPWTKDLLKVIDESGTPWCFLSKTSRDSGSSSGKYKCIETWFPQYLNKLWLVRGTKSYMAAEGKALLDDKKKNLQEWISAGGIGIHWSEIHSSKIEQAKIRIDALKEELSR